MFYVIIGQILFYIIKSPSIQIYIRGPSTVFYIISLVKSLVSVLNRIKKNIG